jgi:hypothetical protein
MGVFTGLIVVAVLAGVRREVWVNRADVVARVTVWRVPIPRTTRVAGAPFQIAVHTTLDHPTGEYLSIGEIVLHPGVESVESAKLQLEDAVQRSSQSP